MTQQQLLEEQQRVPSLIVEDRAQDRHPRQIPISTDIEGQASCFVCCRATGEEKSLRLALTHSPLAKERSECDPLRFPWLLYPTIPIRSGPFARGICFEEPEPSRITDKNLFAESNQPVRQASNEAADETRQIHWPR